MPPSAAIVRVLSGSAHCLRQAFGGSLASGALDPWLEATSCEAARDRAHRVVSVAAVIATGVKTDGRREILALGLGPSNSRKPIRSVAHLYRRATLVGMRPNHRIP